MNKIILTAAAMLTCAATAMAVPAKRITRTVCTADGVQRQLTLQGDENGHFYIDPTGTPYVQDAQGEFRATTLFDVTAHRQQRAARQLQRRQQRAAGKHRATWGAASNPISGRHTGLVILVNYADKKLTYGQAEYTRYFNQQGYNRSGMGGSVHDYFYSQSYGQFDLEFDVVGPVTLSHNLDYYGRNDANGDDLRAATMVGEAVRLAKSNSNIDFRDYDWDGDGEVDQVYVIYAGYGEAAGGAANTIWPHEYELDAAKYFGDGQGSIYLDGVRINTYACSNELAGSTGTSIDGIGTACHEFSHCMAIPDMYDVNGSNYGMDYWDLMDYGCYAGPNENGECPCGYTAYERMYCGWLKPMALTEGCVVMSLRCLDQYPDAYIIYNDAARHEYYMLENRQLEGWYRYSLGHGMLVTHVDYDSQAWLDDEVNVQANHQRMTIIPADNSFTVKYVSDYEGDTYPGSRGNTSLTDTSRPAAKLYNANAQGTKYMGKPITNIREMDGLISFYFMGGGPVVDAITAPAASLAPASSAIYDLQGRRVAGTHQRSGIYVQQGRKFVGR